MSAAIFKKSKHNEATFINEKMISFFRFFTKKKSKKKENNENQCCIYKKIKNRKEKVFDIYKRLLLFTFGTVKRPF